MIKIIETHLGESNLNATKYDFYYKGQKIETCITDVYETELFERLYCNSEQCLVIEFNGREGVRIPVHDYSIEDYSDNDQYNKIINNKYSIEFYIDNEYLQFILQANNEYKNVNFETMYSYLLKRGLLKND